MGRERRERNGDVGAGKPPGDELKDRLAESIRKKSGRGRENLTRYHVGS